MEVTAYGPAGCLMAIGSVRTEIHGVKSRIVASGREVSNPQGRGDAGMRIFYVDGKRASRSEAMARLEAYISKGQQITLSGPARLAGDPA